MNKTFFISNRQSGKTHLSIYEFLKNPDRTIFISPTFKMEKSILQTCAIEKKHFINFFHSFSKLESALRTGKYDRVIFDDYLFLTFSERKNYYNTLEYLGIKEIYCFTTPFKIYDLKMFDFIRELKKKNKYFNLEEWFVKDELLIEFKDPKIKSKIEIENELMDLYYNYITDIDTKIIHNKYFYNDKIYNLDNVSYFPEVEKELTELKAEFLKND